MRKIFAAIVCTLLMLSGCQDRRPVLFTIGILQMNDAPTLNETRKGFIESLAHNGLVDGQHVRILVENGGGSISAMQRIAEGFASRRVDMIVALSTPSLQAALHATDDIPIIFASVANPYLAGAGASAEDHLPHVAGVSSEGPIRESLNFMKSVLPHAKRIGTLWTPSELNSNYYLEKARTGALELDLEIIAVPIANASEVLLSAQILINKKIDVIYQISDNTINQAFHAVGRVAVDNGIPLFGGFLYSTEQGACAALGWDFYDMGYKAGAIAAQVKNGRNPRDIPFQYMDRALLYINLKMAEKQGISFSSDVLQSADRILDSDLSMLSLATSLD
jgi:putative ABC transport system substrate-binding protein